MDKKLMLLQGKRLKEIRKVMGKTQADFAEWLNSIGITGNYGEPYKERTIASWETGRRVLPNAVKKAISEHVTIDNKNIQYGYLNGENDNITQTHFDKINTPDYIKNSSEKAIQKRYQVLTAYNIDIHFMNWLLCHDFFEKFNFEYKKDWTTDNFTKIVFTGSDPSTIKAERIKYDSIHASWIENGYYDIHPYTNSSEKIRFILLFDSNIADVGFLAFTHNDLLHIKELQDSAYKYINLLNIKSLVDSGKIQY